MVNAMEKNLVISLLERMLYQPVPALRSIDLMVELDDLNIVEVTVKGKPASPFLRMKVYGTSDSPK